MTDDIVDPFQPALSLRDQEVGPWKLPLAPRFERLALTAAVSLQVLMLVAMIVAKTVPFLGARTVLLHVVPVDPRDFFRGDYVTLGYDFSLVSGGFSPGESVYVTLVAEPDGRHFRAGDFLHQPPASGVFIEGAVGTRSRATYGIESYYLQEKTGHDYEAAVRSGNLWAEVALDANGRAGLKRLVIE